MKPLTGEKLDARHRYSVEIVAIADMIANFHDWSVEDLEKEFKSCVHTNFPELSLEFASELFASFMEIDVTRRFDPHFNHAHFVADQMDLWKRKHPGPGEG